MTTPDSTPPPLTPGRAFLVYAVGLVMQAWDSVNPQPGPETDGADAIKAWHANALLDWTVGRQHVRLRAIHDEHDARHAALASRQRIRTARADFHAAVTERLAQAATVYVCDLDSARREGRFGAVHERPACASCGGWGAYHKDRANCTACNGEGYAPASSLDAAAGRVRDAIKTLEVKP